jgi:tRNA A37 threonylcarbamoyladenosine modification protein TsaB
MTYILRLTVNQDASVLRLMQDEEIVGERSWQEERDMGKQLLSALQGILTENAVDKTEIKEFVIDGNAKENFTSRRIAETVQKVYTFAINQQ